MQQVINIKNSVWVNVAPSLLMGSYFSFIVFNQPDPVFKILNGIIILVFFATAVREFQKKYYLQIDHELVRINFRYSSKSFLRSEIEYIKLNYAPFSYSYFRLKNGKKVSFDAWSMSDSETEKFRLIHSDVRDGY